MIDESLEKVNDEIEFQIIYYIWIINQRFWIIKNLTKIYNVQRFIKDSKLVTFRLAQF